MKSVWINAEAWSREIIKVALESGADAVVVPEGYTERTHALGHIKTVAPDGDVKTGRDVAFMEITNKADEQRAAKAAEPYIVLKMRDWKVIPIENLLAQRGGVLVEVASSEDAKLMSGILEKGVDGVVIKCDNHADIRRAVTAVKTVSAKVNLQKAKITRVVPLGLGDRVCVDTCTEMKPGQGILAGNASDGFFLVHSESIDNGFAPTRPFRVNAGALHAYMPVPGGKTKYLSDLRSGDPVLIVNAKGETEQSYVGRAKVERRPLLLVAAEVEQEKGKREIGLVLQNAETVRLTRPDGSTLSVAAAKPGDEILAHVCDCARHAGTKVSETISER